MLLEIIEEEENSTGSVISRGYYLDGKLIATEIAGLNKEDDSFHVEPSVSLSLLLAKVNGAGLGGEELKVERKYK